VSESEGRGLSVAGLFAGIGGIELGLRRTGHDSEILCEIEPGARRVLETRFPGVEICEDVVQLDQLPAVDLVAAGFPCQDLSQAGSKNGIGGSKSGVVEHLFRLLEGTESERPPWVLIENVSYMLRLDLGGAMEYLVERLEALGYHWAYRVVDARAFGIPQRRQRVLLLAGREADPAPLLLARDAGEPSGVDTIGPVHEESLYGFYWTEGRRGLGWARDAIPTLKGGSGVGIPSPPAIWEPAAGFFGLPSLEDAERLQGFPAGWTEPADEVYDRPRRQRWCLAGNAVCVPVAEWVGQRLRASQPGRVKHARELRTGERWPLAAYGGKQGRFAVDVSMRPTQRRFTPLGEFLTDPLTPLSERAAKGFLSRAREGKLHFGEGFLDDLDRYIADWAEEPTALASAA
jgi:DNA (cytosine-5)-methyltransferase 1